VLCAGASTGAIDVTVSGGTAPYRYAWSHGVTTQDLSQVPAGNYALTVTDARGCTVLLRDTLSQPDSLQFTSVITNNLCGIAPVGGVQLQVSGGTAPYTYLWSNGNTGQHLTGVTGGNYSVVVTDANGCTRAAAYTIDYSCLGTAKSVSNGPVNNRDGSYSLTYDILVENLGQTVLSQVQLIDNLANTFPAPATFVVDSLLSPSLTVNASYNGQSQTSLLATAQQLGIGGSALIRLFVRVTPGANLGVYNNQVQATASDPRGTTVRDTSTVGNQSGQPVPYRVLGLIA
jgi:hypothetical protein